MSSTFGARKGLAESPFRHTMSAPSQPPRISCLQVADIELPREVDGLLELAYNLWWTWTPTARHLFASITPETWARYRNPVELLLNFDRTNWEGVLQRDAFGPAYDGVLREFKAYVDPQRPTWFSQRFADYDGGPIAYFSMEYGIHQSLAVYSGGLGVLSGDHCKSASDLGLPFVAVGLAYRRGYFRQAVDADGFQQHHFPEYDFTRLPLRPALDGGGRRVTVQVPLPGRQVAVRVWLAQVGRVPLLLLDTDIAANDPADRPISGVLYVRGREMRLAQETVLGIGGVKALTALGIRPAAWHINEGHSALLQVERLRQALEKGGEPAAVLKSLARTTAFTTHTPVAAGNEQFDRHMAEPYLEAAAPAGVEAHELLDLGRADHDEPNQPLNLTALALRTSSYANGVSRLNGEVADRMWRHLSPGAPAEEPLVDAITNGVHIPTWLGLELRTLLRGHLGTTWYEDLLGTEAWEKVAEISDKEIWDAHQGQKERLLRFTRARMRKQYGRHGRSPGELREIAKMFRADALTIGFARRFATYKRAGLLFSDLHRVRQLLDHAERPVQIFLAGKAHPADRAGQDLIRHLVQLSREPDLKGRVVFLENYDMRVARMLVQGCDVWLNTPRRPLEASGTSGQKAAINGLLNLSILDGWWPEGWDGENGFAFGSEEPAADEWEQDQEDALALYHTLEEEVVPAYFERDEDGLPRAWIGRMRRAMTTIGPRFSSSRMVRDYVEKAYMPLARGDGEPLVG
jgi:starch phosphorylase